MNDFTNFLGDHYFIFVLITLFLIFALVGFFIDMKRRKSSPFKIDSNPMSNTNLNIDNIQVTNNVGLSQYVNDNKTVNNDTSNNYEGPDML